MKPIVNYIDGISPINSLDEFGNILSNKATPLLEKCDIRKYFEPKIEAMKSFSLGMYQWCIVDFADQRLLEVGGMLEEMTGKPAEYWKGMSPERYVEEVGYAEHIPYWMAYVDYVYSFILNNPNKTFRPNIYLKMRDAEGNFRNVVQQVLDWKYEEDGGVRYCLCQVTDISHMEVDYIPQLSILIVDGDNHKLLKSLPANIETKYMSEVKFTKREIEVVRLLSLGMTSKIIAEKLNISKNTVENHRQRLLKKTNSYTSSEVVAYALIHGLI